jgi:hypothetical protein
VEGEFKSYVDAKDTSVYYMVGNQLIKFELPAATLKHGGDSKAILKGQVILESPVKLKQTLVFENYLIIQHSDNVVSIFNKDSQSVYNIETFKDLDSDMMISGFQNKKEDLIFVLYSDFHIISVIYKAK